jgi:hypothetical protein
MSNKVTTVCVCERERGWLCPVALWRSKSSVSRCSSRGKDTGTALHTHAHTHNDMYTTWHIWYAYVWVLWSCGLPTKPLWYHIEEQRGLGIVAHTMCRPTSGVVDLTARWQSESLLCGDRLSSCLDTLTSVVVWRILSVLCTCLLRQITVSLGSSTYTLLLMLHIGGVTEGNGYMVNLFSCDRHVTFGVGLAFRD